MKILARFCDVLINLFVSFGVRSLSDSLRVSNIDIDGRIEVVARRPAGSLAMMYPACLIRDALLNIMRRLQSLVMGTMSMIQFTLF